MTTQKKCSPALRFAGFTDDWEQRKLGEITTIIMGQSPSSESYTNNPNDHILVQGNADIKNGYVYPRVWTNRITKPASKNDLILTVRAPVGDVAKTKYDIVLGRGVAAIKGNEFIFQYLTKMKTEKFWEHLSSGSTFNSINSNDIQNVEINFPSDEEQTQIGNLFNQLDETIALHKRKLKKQQNSKKFYLEKMFPKENSLFPEIRFPNFTDAWEQRKLGEIVDIIGGGTPSTNNAEYWNGNIDWYSPTEIGNQTYANGSLKKITDQGLQKSSAKILPKNKTILFTSRASIGDMAILTKQGTTNQGFQSFVVKDQTNIYFLYSLGKKIKEFAIKNASGSTFLEISKNKLAQMPIKLPNIEEQTQIGNLFNQLDETIALHKRMIEKLEKIKQAYLERMFI